MSDSFFIADSFGGFYRGKRILLTGDTGFKGSWLGIWLNALGAEVTGVGLDPLDRRQLFVQANLEELFDHRTLDVRNLDRLTALIAEVKPDVVFHLAAQALVRDSYADPIGTFETNVIGTANLLEALRRLGKPCAVVAITSDKCYENREWDHAYRENDAMGGYDPYSASKGCAELVVASMRRSFFPLERLEDHGVRIASARAGNVIGPGDWAANRIVRDAVEALLNETPIPIRSPGSIRPWQHVLEPLSGYLTLGEKLGGSDAPDYCEAWNFGPLPQSHRTVRELIELFLRGWGSGSWEDRSDPDAPHEAKLLKLAIDKAVSRLGWAPVWEFEETVSRTAKGYRELFEIESDPSAARSFISATIADFMKSKQ